MNNELIKKIDFNNEEQCVKLIESGMPIELIPMENRTPKMCHKVFENNPWFILSFQDDDEFFKEEVLLKGLEKEPDIITFIPIKYRTPNIYLKAFEGNVYNFKCFPHDNDELFKEENCIKAITEDSFLFQDIPKKYITDRILLEGFKSDPRIIEYFPQDRIDLFTDDICKKACEYPYESLLEYIPMEKRTTELCLKDFEHHPTSIKFFPKDNKEVFTDYVCEKACEYTFESLLGYIPIEKRTTRLCLKSYNNNPLAMIYFPDDNPDLFTEVICIDAIRKYRFLFKFIPMKYMTKKIGDIYESLVILG